MTDPFLLAHLIRPLCFDIGGRLSPISIRDMMIRGRMIVDRAVEAGLLVPAAPGLLVVGAGAIARGVRIGRANVVILRHGINTPPLQVVGTQTSVPFPRQMLPYHVPA